MLVENMYSTTWYALPPKYRKMIHILQGQFRKRIQFTAFRIYPITMATFANALKFVYSIINIIRKY